MTDEVKQYLEDKIKNLESENDELKRALMVFGEISTEAYQLTQKIFGTPETKDGN